MSVTYKILLKIFMGHMTKMKHLRCVVSLPITITKCTDGKYGNYDLTIIILWNNHYLYWLDWYSDCNQCIPRTGCCKLSVPTSYQYNDADIKKLSLISFFLYSSNYNHSGRCTQPGECICNNGYTGAITVLKDQVVQLLVHLVLLHP